jgi:hypothetical protein
MAEMTVSVFGIEWECDYDLERTGHVVLNNVTHKETELFDFLDEKVLLKIQAEIECELAEMRAWREEEAAYEGEWKRDLMREELMARGDAA